MADVTEVIHKISYEVNDEALINATKAIQLQVAELNKLGVALNGYTQQLAKLSSAQTQQFDALLSKISSTNNKITELSSKAQGAITEILKGVVDGFGKDPDLQSNVKKYVTAVKKQYKELTNEVEAYKKTSIGFGKDVGDGLAKGAKSSELNLGKLAKSLASTTGLLDIGISLLVNFGVELIKDGGILDSFANKQKNVVTETDKIISKFAVLTNQEKASIVAFVRTLTGSAVYTDARWSDPFTNDSLTLITPTGLNELLTHADIKVYPTNATSYVQIDVPQAMKGTQMRVVSMDGRMVYTGVLVDRLDVSNYPSGMYIIVFENKRTERFIKQ